MIVDITKEEVTKEWITDNLGYLVQTHGKQKRRIKELINYYNGLHDILNRTMTTEYAANNKLVNNFPKYITTVSVGYFMGNPISYQATKASLKGKVDKLKKIMKKSDVESVDIDNATDDSISGVAYEFIKSYTDYDGKLYPKSFSLSPERTFVVYDNSVEEIPLLGIYYMESKKEGRLVRDGRAIVVTDSKIYEFTGEYGAYNLDSERDHFFGIVPIIEYKNNSYKTGDFEPVLSLINAYNLLQSDRINDKEQLIDAILKIKGADMEDSETINNIKENRILVLPKDGDAEWLTKNLDEADADILRKVLEEDIHKFSLTPNITDDQFSGNASGVAMQYKLFGFEQLIKTKERFYQEGLRWRIIAYLNFLDKTGELTGLTVDDVEFVFNRNLPTNNIEIAQMVSQLANILSRETLISQVPFVKDVDIEVDRIKKEEKERTDTMKENFGFPQVGEGVNESRNESNETEEGTGEI